jgi:small subunit ribosomal protein S15
MALTKRQKQNTIKDIKQHNNDTGSTEVQIAILTRRITELSDHLKKHRGDNHSRRGLLKLVAQRRKLVKYLQKTSKKRYNLLAKSLGLKTVS